MFTYQDTEYKSRSEVARKLLTEGVKKADIAKSLGITYQTVHAVQKKMAQALAKEAQEKVLEIVLKEKDVEKALKYVKKVIHDLRDNKVPLDKVIIFTQLQKDIGAYESIGPHVAVAKRMQEQGVEVGVGTLVKFVVTKGSGIIRDRAKLPEEVSVEDYDPDYYINNQVIPAVERIFAVLGYGKDILTESKDQSKLGEFFG